VKNAPRLGNSFMLTVFGGVGGVFGEFGVRGSSKIGGG
jgi:hypothetical protein